MKSRLVRPEFWTDGKIVQLSAFARLLFIACWQMADDEGRFEWEPIRVKLQVFPADSVDIGELGAELGGLGLIRFYSVGGKDFACVPKFADHQKLHPDRPSKLPPPPDAGADLGQSGPVRAEVRPSRARAQSEPNLTQPNPTEPNASNARQARGRAPDSAIRVLTDDEYLVLAGRVNAGEVVPPEDHAALGLRVLREYSGRDFRTAPLILARCRAGATAAEIANVCAYFAQLVEERPDFWRQHFDATTPFRPEKFDGYRVKAAEWIAAGRPFITPEGEGRAKQARRLALGRGLPESYAVAG